MSVPAPFQRAPDPAAPQSGVDVPAHGVLRVLAIRIVLSVVVIGAALVAAALLYRASINTSTWGPYLSDQGTVEIVYYSAPWLAGAAGCLLVAGLLVVFIVKDAVRIRRVRRALARSTSTPSPSTVRAPG